MSFTNKKKISRNNKRKEEAGAGNAPSTSSSSNTLGGAASVLLRDAATFNFVEPIGYSLDLGTDDPVTKYHNIPGIITMTLAPSIGRCDRQNSAPNIAATNVFADVRRANSGRVEYEDWDLMFYYITMGNVYSFIQWCIRLYGCLNLASTVNRYLPIALVESQKVDYYNLRDNMANFRFWLNHFITRVAQFAVPATLPYIAEEIGLYQDLYCESTSIKDQLYMYVPEGFYTYHVDTEKGPHLMRLALSDFYSDEGKLNVDCIMNYGECLLDAINQDQDWKIMSGDTAKAFGDNLVKLALIDEMVALVPTVDLNVLNQFANATVVPVKGSSLDIIQKVLPEVAEGYMYHVPEYAFMDTVSDTVEFDYLSQNRILSLNGVDPTCESVIVATRLMHTCAHDASEDKLTLDGGIALATNCHIWYYDQTGALRNVQAISIVSQGNTPSISEVGPNMERLCLLSQFKYAPRVHMYHVSGDGILSMFRYGSIDMFRTMSPTEIRKLNDAAIMATFNSRPVALSSK